jgi:hypothetical protein
VEAAAAADRRKEEGRRSAAGVRDGAARPAGDVLERTTVLAERDVAVGPAVDVLEDHARQRALRQPPQVGDVQDIR